MPNNDPIVLRRMLALRQFPIFAGVQLDELIALAENVVERTMVAGERLVRADNRMGTLHFILNGQIDAPTQSWRPRDVCGIFEALADREQSGQLLSTTSTQSLDLPSRELREILEDNVGILLSILRELAIRIPADRTMVPMAPSPSATSGTLGLVERVIFLRQLMPFAHTHFHALAKLADASEQITLLPGTVVAHGDELATRALVIIDGELQVHRHGSTPIRCGAATAIG